MRRAVLFTILGAAGALILAAQAGYASQHKSGNPPGFTKLTLVRAAVSTAKIRLGSETMLAENCEPHGSYDVQLVDAPAHGQVTIETMDDYPAYQPPNPRIACNSHKVPMRVIFYQAQPNFSGQDSAVVMISTSNGAVRQITYNIRVVASKS